MTFTKMAPETLKPTLLRFLYPQSLNSLPMLNVLQVTRVSKQDGDAENEQMLQTKLEIKNRSRDNHFFHKVQVSRLNVLVSYKASRCAQCIP
jgi:hypothetical protein